MASATGTPIQLFYSTTATTQATAGQLQVAELFLNVTDRKLYSKDNSGNVFLLANGNNSTATVSSVAVSGGTTGLTTSGGPITTSGTITLAGTLALTNGGTGGTSASGARTNLAVPGLADANTFSNTNNFQDNEVIRPKVKDYSLTVNALGNITGATTVNLEVGNYVTATCTGNITWTFSNPATSGSGCGFIMVLTNGGAFTQTWPAAVDWPYGVAPTLTASGTDVLVFITNDGGTTWRGTISMTDSK